MVTPAVWTGKVCVRAHSVEVAVYALPMVLDIACRHALLSVDWG